MKLRSWLALKTRLICAIASHSVTEQFSSFAKIIKAWGILITPQLIEFISPLPIYNS